MEWRGRDDLVQVVIDLEVPLSARSKEIHLHIRISNCILVGGAADEEVKRIENTGGRERGLGRSTKSLGK